MGTFQEAKTAFHLAIKRYENEGNGENEINRENGGHEINSENEQFDMQGEIRIKVGAEIGKGVQNIGQDSGKVEIRLEIEKEVEKEVEKRRSQSLPYILLEIQKFENFDIISDLNFENIKLTV